MDKKHKPFLGRNDLELLFNYLLEHKIGLRDEWDRAAAEGTCESFLANLCSGLAEKGCAISIVRTREDGSKIVLDLSQGFITTVFDVKI
jgi:hypothetical protein